MADNLIYEMSSSSPSDSEPFIRRDILNCIDSNQGSYGGVNQLIYETATLSNNGMWQSYSEAWIEVPVSIVLSAEVAEVGGSDISDAAGADFLVALKNGSYHLINSMSVEMNNTTIIQQTNMSNIHMAYRLNTQSSLNDVSLNGATSGFALDSAHSWRYSAGATTSSGSRNNTTRKYAANQREGLGFEIDNNGIYQRQQFTMNPQALGTSQGMTDLMTYQNIDTYGVNSVYPAVAGTASTAAHKVWHYTVLIKLRDIHPFFEPQNLPLTKGTYFKFVFNLNQSVTSFTYNTGSYADNVFAPLSRFTILPGDSTVYGGGCNPMMLCEGFDKVATQGNPSALVTGKKYKVSCSVVRPIDSTQAGYPNAVCKTTSTRLFVPSYILSPQKEKQYLELHRTKTIKYDDIYQYQTNIAKSDGGGSIATSISNGISKLKSIVICPFINNDSSVTGGAGGLASYRSPLASEPATCSPMMYFNNFNVKISGITAFRQNINYSFEAFLTELQSTGLNGNMTRGLCSGLISKDMFENNYGYLVVDCSRRLPQAFVAPASVELVGNYIGKAPIQLVTFCAFEREITIDTFTGDIIGSA